jgi:hypothetical protein
MITGPQGPSVGHFSPQVSMMSMKLEFAIVSDHIYLHMLRSFAVPLLHRFLHIHLYWISANFVSGTVDIRLAQACAVDDCTLRSALSLSTGEVRAWGSSALLGMLRSRRRHSEIC